MNSDAYRGVRVKEPKQLPKEVTREEYRQEYIAIYGDPRINPMILGPRYTGMVGRDHRYWIVVEHSNAIPTNT